MKNQGLDEGYGGKLGEGYTWRFDKPIEVDERDLKDLAKNTAKLNDINLLHEYEHTLGILNTLIDEIRKGDVRRDKEKLNTLNRQFTVEAQVYSTQNECNSKEIKEQIK